MKFKILDKVVWDTFPEVYTVIGFGQIKNTYNIIQPFSEKRFDVPESDLTLIYSEKPKNKYDFLKMYVLVKDTAPIGLGINACSHVGFLAAKTFDSQITDEWEKCSFKKVTCLVSPEQFDEAIKEIEKIGGNYVRFNEDDWECQDISVAFEPRYSFPDIFKTFNLHSGVV